MKNLDGSDSTGDASALDSFRDATANSLLNVGGDKSEVFRAFITALEIFYQLGWSMGYDKGWDDCDGVETKA